MAIFGGKKERLLEEELEELRDRHDSLLKTFEEQKESVKEQLRTVGETAEKMEKSVGQLDESIRQMGEMSEKGENAASDLHGELVRANNAVESFSANHAVFLEQMDLQNEQITDLVEGNRELMPPMEYIIKFPEKAIEKHQKFLEKTESMRDFSKNMSVVALNAAIEAGRMGAAGNSFVTAAQEVHYLSQVYEQATGELKELILELNRDMEELSTEVERLKSAAREHTIAIGKLAAGSDRTLATYRTGQVDIHGLLQEDVIGRIDALLDSERETVRLKEHMAKEIETMKAELDTGQKVRAEFAKVEEP